MRRWPAIPPSFRRWPPATAWRGRGCRCQGGPGQIRSRRRSAIPRPGPSAGSRTSSPAMPDTALCRGDRPGADPGAAGLDRAEPGHLQRRAAPDRGSAPELPGAMDRDDPPVRRRRHAAPVDVVYLMRGGPARPGLRRRSRPARPGPRQQGMLLQDTADGQTTLSLAGGAQPSALGNRAYSSCPCRISSAWPGSWPCRRPSG